MKRANLLLGVAISAAIMLRVNSQARVNTLGNNSQLMVSAFQNSLSVKSEAAHLRGIPRVFTAEQNYPNPFNSTTTIEYNLPQEAGVYVSVYDIFGRRVRTLVNGSGSPGYHVVSWDGRNEAGKLVASGVYFYQVVADDFFAVRKMRLLK